MMRSFFLFTGIFFFLSTYSQTKQDSIVQKLFDQAEQKTSDSAYWDAMRIYKDILAGYSLDRETYERVKYNLGYLYYYLNDLTEAKKCFRELINYNSQGLPGKQKASFITKEFQPFHQHFAACALFCFTRNVSDDQ